MNYKLFLNKYLKFHNTNDFFIFVELVPIDYYETPRGAKGILCNGYYFVKEKAFGKTINW